MALEDINIIVKENEGFSETILWVNPNLTQDYSTGNVTPNESINNFTYLKFIIVPYKSINVTTYGKPKEYIVSVDDFINNTNFDNDMALGFILNYWDSSTSTNYKLFRGISYNSSTQQIRIISCRSTLDSSTWNSYIIPAAIIGMR